MSVCWIWEAVGTAYELWVRWIKSTQTLLWFTFMQGTHNKHKEGREKLTEIWHTRRECVVKQTLVSVAVRSAARAGLCPLSVSVAGIAQSFWTITSAWRERHSREREEVRAGCTQTRAAKLSKLWSCDFEWSPSLQQSTSRRGVVGACGATVARMRRQNTQHIRHCSTELHHFRKEIHNKTWQWPCKILEKGVTSL